MSEPPVQTSVDEVHAHPHKTGHGWVDMTIAISAISISVISLFVAIAHGRTEEKLVAANSWPFPVYVTKNESADDGMRLLRLRVENGGVGPARIQSVQIRLDGRPVRTRAELMSLCCGLAARGSAEEVRAGLQSQNPIVGVLPARDGVDFLAWRSLPGNAVLWEGLNRARDRLRFSACYCSVLDECWRSDLTPVATPKPVHRCEATRDDYTG